MIAGKRQTGNNQTWRPARYCDVRRQWIADDLIILLGEQGATMDTDTGTAG